MTRSVLRRYVGSHTVPQARLPPYDTESRTSASSKNHNFKKTAVQQQRDNRQHPHHRYRWRGSDREQFFPPLDVADLALDPFALLKVLQLPSDLSWPPAKEAKPETAAGRIASNHTPTAPAEQMGEGKRRRAKSSGLSRLEKRRAGTKGGATGGAGCELPGGGEGRSLGNEPAAPWKTRSGVVSRHAAAVRQVERFVIANVRPSPRRLCDDGEPKVQQTQAPYQLV